MPVTIWRKFRVVLPDDWELLQFSRNPERGRCAFADRYQFRLELNWRVVPSAPDFDRVMSDYASTLNDDTDEAAVRLRRVGWEGVQTRADGVLSTRFGRYIAEESCLVELVFLWPNRVEDTLIDQILTTFGVDDKLGKRWQRWRAFGIETGVHADLALEECESAPAHARMLFADRKRTREACVARRGMVSQWLDARVKDWLVHWLGRQTAITKQSSTEVRGHRIETATGFKHEPWLRGLWRRRRKVSAAAWLCPMDGRLYSVYLTGCGKNGPEEVLPGWRTLSCCETLGLRL